MFGRLFAAVFLEEFKNGPGLLSWDVSPNAHVEQDGLPLRLRALGSVALGMATIAVHGIQIGTAEFLYFPFWLPLLDGGGWWNRWIRADVGDG